VLITLAIIGIIAAITIPSIVANHKKRTLETQFAKTYRTITQAVNLAVAEYGDISGWDWKTQYSTDEMDDFVKKYFAPYLNIVKFCSADNSVNECFDSNIRHKQPNGNLEANPNTRRTTKVLLADGSAIQFYFIGNALNGRTLAAEFDINGSKKPNAVGRDFFYFGFYPKTGEVLPGGIISGAFDEEIGDFPRYTREETDEACLDTAGAGWSCAAKIVQDGFKMNY